MLNVECSFNSKKQKPNLSRKEKGLTPELENSQGIQAQLGSKITNVIELSYSF